MQSLSFSMWARVATAAALGASSCFLASPTAFAQSNQLVSADGLGVLGNGASDKPTVTADGRFVAFASHASNLVLSDTNSAEDVFVKDLATGVVRRVSVGTGGIQGDYGSDWARISADGTTVAFTSSATNFVWDVNNVVDVYVHHIASGVTTRVSVSTAGLESDGDSTVPAISADGRLVAFESAATNLVSFDTNGAPDVFVHDRATGVTTRRSLGPGGVELSQTSQDPFLSADGRFLSFSSFEDGIVPGDFNASLDVFVVELATGAITCESLTPLGASGNDHSLEAELSADGRFVAFQSDATDLVAADGNFLRDIFVRDRASGTTTRVSVTSAGAESNSGLSMQPTISGDGRVVAFASLADDLVPGDGNGTFDVFLHDRVLGTTERASVDLSGGDLNGVTVRHALPGTGFEVVFASHASDAIANDTNQSIDVFARKRFTPVESYCTSSTSSGGCSPALASSTVAPSLSAGPGSFVVTCSPLDGQRQGIFFYGIGGRLAQPWAAGSTSYLCVKPPTQRTAAQTSGGTAGACDGALVLDFFQFAATHPAALGQPFAPGQSLQLQAWFRDPPAPKTTNLSNALEATLNP
jgi:Tol biopolymer transport system component